MTDPALCRQHAERLDRIDSRLDGIERSQADLARAQAATRTAINQQAGQLAFVADVLRPYSKRSEGPTLALETRWGKIRGSAPWVAVVVAMAVAAAGGGYWASTASATMPAGPPTPAATAGP